ncbi:hypothetical protein [Agreia sp. Leaf283]|uniref:hypothetical protein n=1 Tax=Agreia sp. Leaf283 TaxID=1736321 RepID=UPI0006F9CA47|nr:hypothetical protein [Agreia sp. Leaf283]KQP54504.1 hypothetical protein ASF51_14395 [Agreia sp. Leaf283]
MDPDDRVSARRVNPYEVALWIFGVVAVAAAVWSTQWANSAVSLANGGYYCDDAGNCTERYDFVLTQTVLVLAPSVMIAGLIAIVVALALRAWLAVRSGHGRVSA